MKKRYSCDDLKLYIIVGVIALVVSVWIFGLYHKDWTVPIVYSSDSMGFFLEVENAVRGGNPYLYKSYAAPFGMDHKLAIVDYHLYLWPIVLLAKIIGNTVLAVNISLLLTYIMTAWSALWVLRKFQISEKIACFMAVLYALLPYHTFRNELHFTLSCIQFIPLMGYLVLVIMDESKKCFNAECHIKFRNKIDICMKLPGRRFILSSSVLCLLMGLGSAYYSAFTCILFVFAGVYILIKRKAVINFLYSIYLSFLILLTSLITVLPGIISFLTQDNGYYGASRSQSDVALGSMHIISLFLPIYNHIIKAFGSFSSMVNGALNYNQEKAIVFLGGLMSLGLVFSIGYTLCFYRDDLISNCGRCNLFLLLLSIPGGINSFVSLYITSSIRNYSRTVVFIAFFSVIALGIVLDERIELIKDVTKRILLWCLLIIIALVGVVPTDYGSTWVEIPQYKDILAEFSNDKKFTEEIEKNFTDESMIFEFPIVTEDDINVWPDTGKQGAYNLYKPVINGKKGYWSQGGLINSRAYFWKKSLKQMQPEMILPVLSAYGFEGIYVDMNGYQAEHGQELIAFLENALGNPYISDDGQLYYYDMKVYNDSFQKKYEDKIDEILKMTYIYGEFQNGVISTINDNDCQYISELEKQSSFVIGNVDNNPHEVEVYMNLFDNFQNEIQVRYGEKIIDYRKKGNTIIFKLMVEPGATVLNFTVDEPIKLSYQYKLIGENEE